MKKKLLQKKSKLLVLLAFGFCLIQSVFAISIPGTGGVVEYPGNAESIAYKGWGLEVLNNINATNWVHFGLQTNGGMYDYVKLFITESGTCPHVKIDRVDIYDGKTILAAISVSWIGGYELKVTFSTGVANHAFTNGMGVSVRIAANGCDDSFRKLSFNSVLAHEKTLSLRAVEGSSDLQNQPEQQSYENSQYSIDAQNEYNKYLPPCRGNSNCSANEKDEIKK